MLEAAGIPFAISRVVPPERAAVEAQALGYPLVAKAVAPGLVHKSDVGGVILGLDSREAVAAAVEMLRERVSRAGMGLRHWWQLDEETRALVRMQIRLAAEIDPGGLARVVPTPALWAALIRLSATSSPAWAANRALARCISLLVERT